VKAMSVQDLDELMRDVPIEQCVFIVNIARKIILAMHDKDLLVSEQLLLPKVLEIAIKDIHDIDGLGIIKDGVVLAKRNRVRGTEH